MNPQLRLLDANGNRALEAARVLEDLARFGLGDAESAMEIAGEGKAIRHGIRAGLDRLDPRMERVTLARDTEGDPGTRLTAPGEHDRAGLRGVAAAAGSRLGEALRVLEEIAKLTDPDAGAAFESLRYRGYTLAQRVVGAISPTCPQWRLCVLITEALCAHHGWLEVARRAIAGGADCLQLREKSLGDRELLERARALVKLAETTPVGGTPGGNPRRCSVIINDRPDIALLSGADGVHLGKGDLGIADARTLLGDRWIGISTADPTRARLAIDAGADYVGLGPMYPSSTKPKDNLSGPGYLRAFLGDPGLSGVPHLAISGINAARARELGALGCLGVAVSSAVCASPDPERAAREIFEAINAGTASD